MTGFTRRGESRCRVGHWCSRIVVIGLMARDACRTCQIVVVIDVTIRASSRRHHVRTSKRETSAVVIERGIQPSAGAVALIASLREIRRHVVRIRGSLKILQVAAHAGVGVETVIIGDVAVGASAGWNCVHARQGKAGGRVIERGVSPSHRIVALLAGRWEAAVWHRRCRIVEIGLVAAHARNTGDVVVVVDVAVGAGARRHHVRAGQREP